MRCFSSEKADEIICSYDNTLLEYYRWEDGLRADSERIGHKIAEKLNLSGEVYPTIYYDGVLHTSHVQVFRMGWFTVLGDDDYAQIWKESDKCAYMTLVEELRGDGVFDTAVARIRERQLGRTGRDSEGKPNDDYCEP